ncbi:MAG: hypothetical protein Q7R72_01790 [bacterium]|nr:hypothetical protein [bacterium]
MEKLRHKTKITSGVVIIVTTFLGLFFWWIIRGELIHDINSWRLQIKFYVTDIPHPQSVLLKKISYLGGPSFHGDNRCIYAVGEIRTSPLTKTEIRSAYSSISIDFGRKILPLQVLFADEYEGPYTMPYVDWQDELREIEVSKDTPYVVYVSAERPVIFYDGRCDD